MIALIIWQGLGFLVLVIAGVAFFGTQFTVDAVLEKGYYAANTWPKLLAAFLAAVPLWALGRRLHAKQEVRHPDGQVELVDPPGRHTLYFVPIEFWAIIVPVLLIVLGPVDRPREKEPPGASDAPIRALDVAAPQAKTASPANSEPRVKPAKRVEGMPGYWSYRNSKGSVVLVDSFDKIPEKYRPK